MSRATRVAERSPAALPVTPTASQLGDRASERSGPAGEPRPITLLADRWLWAILALALACRLAVRWLAPVGDWLGDEREYYSAAAILADGRGLAFLDEALWLRPPLYIGALAGLFRLFGPGVTPVWLAQTLLGVAMVALVYLLGRLLYGRPAVARLAATLCAVYLPFVVYARLLLSETLFVALVVGAVTALVLYARRGGRAPLVAAGAALGLASLTRGLALPFLAAVPVWLAVVHRREGGWGTVARRSALVIGVVLLLVAPWIARNALAYGRLIPVDTTGGYNFWLGAAGLRAKGQIDNTLREIPNHGDRQALAYARGWAVVRADPGGYLARAGRELADLWRINFGANERLLQGFTRGQASPLWLGLTLVLDDLLYLAALPLAVLGWPLTRRREDRWLVGLWLGYSCLTGALFFAITRFRLPLMPFVLLLAARGALGLGEVRARLAARPPRPSLLLPAALFLAIALVVYPSFEPTLYAAGARGALARQRLERGYELLAAGYAPDALAEFERLPADYYARPTALAAAQRVLAGDEWALAALDEERDPIGAALLRGDILRGRGTRGDEAGARRIFAARDVRVANPTEEAWRRLSPPPRARLDVGDGLDLGYLRGFALEERETDGTTLRWTGARAELRLTPDVGGEATLRLRLKGYRPGGAPPLAVRIAMDGRSHGVVTPTTEWQIHGLPLSVSAGRTVVVRLDTPTFVPGYVDQRQLGVMVDWVEIVPATGP